MFRLRIHFEHAGLNAIEKSLGQLRVFSRDVPIACQIATRRMGHVSSRCSPCCSIREKIYFLENQRFSRSIENGGLRDFSTASSKPRKTCLYNLHTENKGKIVNFAGWLLPVQYTESIAESHQYTRVFASIFDVSHMLQTRVTGRNATEYLESLTPSDLQKLDQGRATLSVFTNENGGVMDDLIITKDEENKFFMVSNAGRREEDTELLLKRKLEFEARGKKINIEFLDPLEQGLIALQGPFSAKVLQPFVKKIDLTKLTFMGSVEIKLLNSWSRISRCGYTGEDGFEISVPGRDARELVERMLQESNAKLAGLGARDSLRLEAGLCLYGNDIDESTTPVEAGLTWVIAKRRRAETSFPGAEKILLQIKQGPHRKRIGLTLIQGPPARKGARILTPEGEHVGNVTSGGPSPTLGYSIAMGYVPTDLIQKTNIVLVEVRGKTYRATITKMPFVPTKYYIVK